MRVTLEPRIFTRFHIFFRDLLLPPIGSRQSAPQAQSRSDVAIEPGPPKGAFGAIFIAMRSKIEPFRRASKVTVPEHCHPLARLVFAEMKRQGVTYEELEWRSGCLKSTIKAWRRDNLPSIPTISAALGVLGWDMLPVPKLERLDPSLRADLEAVAAKHGLKALPNSELVASCAELAQVGARHLDARTRLSGPGEQLGV